jgi:hypothetical protein
MRPHPLLLGLALGTLLAGCVSGGEHRGGSGDEAGSTVDPYSDAGAPGSARGDPTGEPQCISTTTGEETEGAGDNPCPQGEYPNSG